MYRTKQILAAAAILIGAAAGANADNFTIAPDSNFTPRVLLDATTDTSLFALGDGSLGFSGLTANSATGLFYAAANDSSGNSYLESFSLGGSKTLTDIGSLGTGFTSGLAFDPLNGNLYGLQNDFSNTGNTYFDQITTGGNVKRLFSLGAGFEGFNTGGLTFDTANGLFYAIGADSNGVSRQFDSISLSGAISQIATLGNGRDTFNGGLYYNAAAGGFLTIETNASGDSTLAAIDGNGSVFPLDGGRLGQGVTNASLTALTQTQTPEPRTAALAGFSLLFIALQFFRKGKLK